MNADTMALSGYVLWYFAGLELADLLDNVPLPVLRHLNIIGLSDDVSGSRTKNSS